MKVIIKRFEGPYVVCKKEDGSFMDIKRIHIPIDSKEGDVLKLFDGKYYKNNEKNIN